LAGTVACNVLQHGAGGLNIDACRLSTSDSLAGGAYAENATDRADGYGNGRFKRGDKSNAGDYVQPCGRWPANLILQHLPLCELMGTKRVEPSTGSGRTGQGARGWDGSEVYRPRTEDRDQNFGGTSYVDEEGKETVEAWACVPGCPVVELDEQSLAGGMHTAGNKRPPSHNVEHGLWVDGGWKPLNRNPDMYGDEGGASRFFKQGQQGGDGVGLPQDLIDYLITMISPPAPHPKAVFFGDVGADDAPNIELWDPDSVTGIIAVGTPSQEMAEHFDRVLVPGGHLLLVAPDDEPTGHTGTCIVEDVGFEIRDSILLVQEEGHLHYVPKASRSEREAGCENLPAKSGAEAVDRGEGTDGLNSPRAGAGRTASKVRNFHPTAKPWKVMVRLLDDVPDDKVILDNFLGAGATGIACVKTGHSFIGIEREKDYLPIADARIRFWNEEWWRNYDIDSDAPKQEEPETSGASSVAFGFLFGSEDD
jgi:hypothetical protein